MEKDPYRRFLRSDLFIKLLDKCQKLENTNPNSPEDNPDNSNSVILTDHVPESTTADEVSPKARRVKTKPSQSIDLGDLRVVSVKLTKSWLTCMCEDIRTKWQIAPYFSMYINSAFIIPEVYLNIFIFNYDDGFPYYV